MKPGVFLKKLVNQLPLMPPGSIHIEPDCITPETPIEMAKDIHKAFPVPSGCADNPIPAQKRCHPTRKIKPLGMLAGGRDAKRMSPLRPSSSQPGMERKSSLILEDHCLPRPQILKFFLTRGETAWLLAFAPEDTYSRPASSDIPADASSSEPAGPSISLHIDASNVPPASGRPNGLDSARTAEEIAPNGLRPVRQSEESIGPASPVESCPLKLPNPSHLRPGPSGSDSSESNPKRPQSSPAFDPPSLTEGPQSLGPLWLREYPWPKPRDDPWRPRDE